MRATKYDWGSIDWSKSSIQISSEIGCSVMSASRMRNEYAPNTKREKRSDVKSRLPNGKENPEYRKLWSMSKSGKKSVKKSYHNFIHKKKEMNEICSVDEVKCLECGMVFKKLEAEISGFKFPLRNRFRGICGECQEEVK